MAWAYSWSSVSSHTAFGLRVEMMIRMRLLCTRVRP